MIIFNESNFEDEVANSEVPVLLDFWAPWCGPCNAMTPVLEQLGEEFHGRAKVGKINIEEQKELAAAHEVSAIPAFVFYKGGEIVKSLVGIQTAESLKKEFEELL